MKIETALQKRLQNIFDLKVTYDIPGDSREQECVFVQVERNRSTIRDQLEVAQVSGRLRIFASSEKLPLGYCAKRIAKANQADVKDLFFFEIEENAGTFNNIVERSIGFVFFFRNQYNPERGELSDVNITTGVNE